VTAQPIVGRVFSHSRWFCLAQTLISKSAHAATNQYIQRWYFTSGKYLLKYELKDIFMHLLQIGT